MKINLLRWSALTLLALYTLHTPFSTAKGQGTAFTYQGQLNNNGTPLTGNYDFRFELFNTNQTGSPIAPLLTNLAVPVTSGLFTVTLDFGAGIFTGSNLWLNIGVRTNGAGTFNPLLPRQPLTPAPYAIFAATASNLVGTIPPQDFSGVYNNPVTLNSAGNVFTGDGTGLINVNAALLDGLAATNFWQTTGNAGMLPGINFLGTTDNEPLIFRANNEVGLQLQYAAVSSPPPIISSQYGINVIGGFWGNTISSGVVGGTIAGGGESFRFGFNESGSSPNSVTSSYGTVGGGLGNTAGNSATVPGGSDNVATGLYSFAAGQEAQATNQGAFVWADSQSAAFASTANDQFEVRAQGGAQFVTGSAGVSVTTGAGVMQIISEADNVVPSIVVTNGNAYTGHLRFRNYLEVQPNLAGTKAGELDVRNTNGSVTILLNGGTGNASCASLTITGGSDLAEPFRISKGTRSVADGDVVVIDKANPGQLTLTDRPYDVRVAGVMSGANGIHPGIQMHQQGLLDGGQNVALSGRVYVQADTSNGPIEPGDMLTTSSTPGRAMKVTDHSRAQGAILGKAMTGLNQGNGMVLVLVTLQ
jgi:hypothetical protein